MLKITNHQGNAIQNHNEISPSYLSEWLPSKAKQITNVGYDMEKRKLSCTVGGNVNQYSHYGKPYGDFSKY